MGSWESIGDELIDSFLNGCDEDMEELSLLIQDRIGCPNCKARKVCLEYKDTIYQGECALVLNHFFSDTEEEIKESEE